MKMYMMVKPSEKSSPRGGTCDAVDMEVMTKNKPSAKSSQRLPGSSDTEEPAPSLMQAVQQSRCPSMEKATPTSTQNTKHPTTISRPLRFCTK